MKKIPLKSIDPVPAESPQSAYLLDALEILLLGGIWLFVLVMLPVIQHLDEAGVSKLMPVFLKAIGIVTALLSLWVLGLRWIQRSNQPNALHKPATLLAVMALCGVTEVALAEGFTNLTNAPYLLALQAIVGLAYFMALRVKPAGE